MTAGRADKERDDWCEDRTFLQLETACGFAP